MFLFKCGSRNAFNNLMGEGNFLRNYRKLFGLRLPLADTFAGVLCQLEETELEALKDMMVYRLLQKRVLDRWRYNRKFLVAIDGSGIASYKEKHCDQCTKKTYNKGSKKKKEKVVYFHNVLEAKLVTGNGFSISLCTVWIENPEGEYDKQDCERKAFKRLAKKLKKHFPRTALCICADGLYPYKGFFDICQDNNWDYIATLKEKSLKGLWKNIRTTNRECHVNSFEEHSKAIRQKIQWIAKVGFNGHIHNWIQIKEQQTDSQDKQVNLKFVYLTNLKTVHGTVIDVCSCGRLRWKIEKQGFDQQKNHGYNICHKYCRKSYRGMKNFYQCCQIAHIINQLVELSKGFKSRLTGKKTIKHLWTCMNAFMMMGNFNEQEVNRVLAHKTQLQYIE